MMDLKEFYKKVGGNYDEVMGRLMSEARILKYVKRFPDTEEYATLKSALAEENWEVAFRASHTLKGVCLTLGLGNLCTPSVALCENLRAGSPKEPCGPMMEAVTREYEAALAAIAEL